MIRPRFYLAAPYGWRHLLRLATVPYLELCGVDIVATWLNGPDEENLTDAALGLAARQDIHEIKRECNGLILFAAESEPGRGRFAELGAALATYNPDRIHIVGATSTIFAKYPGIHRHDDLVALGAALMRQFGGGRAALDFAPYDPTGGGVPSPDLAARAMAGGETGQGVGDA